ncbi:MAG: 1-(5-phosphoribosyl)-5-((5-phosphoribosylamino)methylideneamino)imidazole-4-carboxamide isomerase, partial [Desulfovibrio sp.]|nr:1-(5-phosphoribosyl)-5-((5-phosphoribosylamino)methylideneamino)imidazole-4-carboxamide isomerase [Desulfovibrio sp.]
MILYPAVDIQRGKAVRLRQGRADASTVFADNPVEAALLWAARGAQWLHVVDLDGAFDGAAKNRGIVQNICRCAGVPVQLGGGVRDESTAKAYLDAGVARLIIGTMALEAPDA